MAENRIFNPFTQELQTVVSNEDDVINNAFRIAIVGDFAQFDMEDKTIDEYNDQSGIDTVDSVNETYDSINKLYLPANTLDSATKLMLHLNGNDGDTTTTDASQSGHTVTFYANNELDTAQKKFGTTSLLCDGVGHIEMADSTDWDFGTADFTIDFWLRMPNVLSPSQSAFGGQGDGATYFACYHTNQSVRIWHGYGGAPIATGNTIINNTWHHIAYVRFSGVMTIYVDGVNQASGAMTDDFNVWNGPFMFGRSQLGEQMTGWLDEIRVSKGVARWTSNFTPPTSEYTGITANMTLISEAKSVASPPATIRLVIREEDVDSITLNTDLLADVSRDDGVTWETITLTVDNQFDANSRILTGSGDVSGQPSGTDLRYRIRTANNKDLKIHGTARLWA